MPPDNGEMRIARFMGALDFIIRQTITYLELTEQPHAAETLTRWLEEARREFGFAPGPSR